ncbi:MAG: cytochrome b/b6 domain-containing protein [Rhizobacter sp.]
MKQQVSRYHPLLVALHWLIALLILVALGVGFFLLAPTPNTDPQKIATLKGHMAGGMLVLALMVIRFIVRLVTAKPPLATTGHPRLDRLAPLAHYGLYVLVIAMAGTGYATGLLAGLPDIVFAGSGAPLPATFMTYPTRVAHGYIAALLVAFIALHVLAALYHQFVKKDSLLRRMWFGQRKAVD